MALVKLEFIGLKEFKEQLRQLPSELAGDAGAIVTRTAHAAAADMIGQYPEGETGQLARRGEGVDGRDEIWRTGDRDQPGQARMDLRSRHGHTPFVERLEPRRHAKAGRVFEPTMVRYRRRMYDELADMMRANGLQVSNSGG